MAAHGSEKVEGRIEEKKEYFKRAVENTDSIQGIFNSFYFIL